MYSNKKTFHKIDIDDLSQLVGSDAIHNFYLSPYDQIQQFLESETSFIFSGFTLGLCLTGTCALKINGREYSLREGGLLLLPPNQLMELIRRSDDFDRRTIMVSLDLILDFPSPMDIDILNIMRHSPILQLSKEKMKRILEYYEFLEKKYADIENPYREDIAKAILYALILDVCGIYKTDRREKFDESKQRREQLSDDFFLLLARYYKKERNVTFYAQKMNRTSKYLSGEIKRITGRSILEWINETIMVEIKLQLKTTDRTISQISEDLNFSSPSVFVQFFKQHSGITPLKYRQS